MKVYITKYALTDGILEKEAVLHEDKEYLSVNGYWTFFKLGRDAFENLEDASKAAGEMRQKKIASLEKQIAKLKSMSFN